MSLQPLRAARQRRQSVREHRARVLARTSAAARSTVHVLAELRPGWRIGVLTNGRADTQRRKVAALGLTEFVDADHLRRRVRRRTRQAGSRPFVAMLEELDVPADRAVFVGDDLDADIFGAPARWACARFTWSGDGWRGVSHTGVRPDARVRSLQSVPPVAARLVEETGVSTA